MSLPAMLLGETVGEILQASKFARQIVEAVDPNPNPKNPKRRTAVVDDDDPKTPLLTTTQRKNNQSSENNNLENCYSELRARRRREKQGGALQVIRTESNNANPPPPSLQRAKSRIIFKVSSSSSSSPHINNQKKKKNEECEKENCKYIANRVSPRNKPWARKTVLFPNPLFHSSSPTKQHNHHQQKFCRTKSPVIGRSISRQSPHKFLIKSPSVSKFHVKIRSPPLSISPTRSTTTSMMMSKKKSPKMISSAAAKIRRSFSPSRLANRLVSPLKSRKSVHKIDYGMKMMSGLKQRPTANAMPSLRS